MTFWGETKGGGDSHGPWLQILPGLGWVSAPLEASASLVPSLPLQLRLQRSFLDAKLRAGEGSTSKRFRRPTRTNQASTERGGHSERGDGGGESLGASPAPLRAVKFRKGCHPKYMVTDTNMEVFQLVTIDHVLARAWLGRGWDGAPMRPRRPGECPH